jgi:hypothetical protein
MVKHYSNTVPSTRVHFDNTPVDQIVVRTLYVAAVVIRNVAECSEQIPHHTSTSHITHRTADRQIVPLNVLIIHR